MMLIVIMKNFLIKKLVVENIQRINNALGEITGGNLNIYVDVSTKMRNLFRSLMI